VLPAIALTTNNLLGQRYDQIIAYN